MNKISVDIPEKNTYQSNKYMREVLPGVWIDVYDLIDGFNVTDGGYQHALKKIVAVGQRGHKDEAEDRKDIYDSVVRSNERFDLMRKKCSIVFRNAKQEIWGLTRYALKEKLYNEEK